MAALPTFEKKRLMGLIAVLSFGLTSLFAVLELGVLIPATFVVGFLILLPLVAVLGDDFPLVEPVDATAETAASADAGRSESHAANPVATLRRRYATGEIGEEEFERRLDRLLETEELDDTIDDGNAGARRKKTGLETELE
ncbi:Short C-terminal domain-containing protein [Halorubrum aquaticum]|uniref:Short C-terminal domain-containing protein n=1 Tax=Halorubrum aquaticum TaxID=387340 RepID=A0A1I3CBW9_9EURY|nr:SHOCT domain-containing protein [Halorubrum aquaticum]SFH71923.1 Short C-terminal domain-containing protein [Halorubrum aquaticum]